MPGPYDISYQDNGLTSQQRHLWMIPGLSMDTMGGMIGTQVLSEWGGSTLQRAGLHMGGVLGPPARGFFGNLKRFGWGGGAIDRTQERFAERYGSLASQRGVAYANAATEVGMIKEAEQRFGRSFWSNRRNPSTGIITQGMVAEERAVLSGSRVGSRMFGLGSYLKGAGRAYFAIADLAFAADIGAAVVGGVYDWKPRKGGFPTRRMGTQFMDTQGAYTMRQRSISAIHDSQLTTRAAIGNEASFMHM